MLCERLAKIEALQMFIATNGAVSADSTEKLRIELDFQWKTDLCMGRFAENLQKLHSDLLNSFLMIKKELM